MKHGLLCSLIGASLSFAGLATAASLPPLPPYDSMILAPDERAVPVRPSLASQFFADFDGDRDQVVTLLEIDQAIAQKVREASGGSSSLSMTQFTQIRIGQGGNDAQKFRALDHNGDGQLSEVEFNHLGAVLFDRMDKNHDDIITRDEIDRQQRRIADAR